MRAGDILRINHNSHSVIVLQVTEGGVTVAEANYRVNGGAGMVHWGRALSKADVEAADYFITRYPENYTPPDDPSAGTEIGSGSLGSLMWKLTGAGTLTISGNGAMTDFGRPSDTPWKDHMDKITSIVIEDGVTASLPDGATVKIVDNHKDFTDVPSRYWGAEAIAFVSARELFAGTTEATFAPKAPMTRAMLMMVLARLDGADTTGGGTWYEKGVAWAVARGVSGVSPASSCAPCSGATRAPPPPAVHSFLWGTRTRSAAIPGRPRAGRWRTESPMALAMGS